LGGKCRPVSLPDHMVKRKYLFGVTHENQAGLHDGSASDHRIRKDTAAPLPLHASMMKLVHMPRRSENGGSADCLGAGIT
jgi:hypothetical protein